MHSDHEINRASWDELAAAHGQDAYYDCAVAITRATAEARWWVRAQMDDGGERRYETRVLRLNQ